MTLTNGPTVKSLLREIDTRPKPSRSFLLTRGYAGTPSLEGRRVDHGDWVLHVFRTGHVESSVSNGRALLWPPPMMINTPATTVINGVVIFGFLCRLYDFVRELRDAASVTDPFAFTVNPWNCNGHSLPSGGVTWTEDHVCLPPVTVEADEATSDVGLRRIADLFWNAFGVEHAPFFDAEGRLEHID